VVLLLVVVAVLLLLALLIETDDRCECCFELTLQLQMAVLSYQRHSTSTALCATEPCTEQFIVAAVTALMKQCALDSNAHCQTDKLTSL
jgi:hypothetical protein